MPKSKERVWCVLNMASLITLMRTFWGDKKCRKCGKTRHLPQSCWNKPSNNMVSSRKEPNVNEIACREVIYTESFAVIKEKWDGDDLKHMNMVPRERANQRKLLHAKVFLGKNSKVTVLADTT